LKAVILASGVGSRLRPLTDRLPKCLIQLSNGKSILELQFDALQRHHITDIIITTGPYEDRIKEFILTLKKKMNVTLVKNEIYKNTNYIYSMYRAREYIDDDILLIHGDLVFHPELLSRLLNSTHENCVLIHRDHRPEKDFKAEVGNDDRVMRISVHLSSSVSHFLAPFYKVSERSILVWLENIAKYVDMQKTDLYAEDALNDLLDRALDLRAVYFRDELCTEIDDMEDLTSVNRKLLEHSID
jgi:phosphoenolpyruvate phosphomutase